MRREVVSLSHCDAFWGRISLNLNKSVNSVTHHLVLYCEQSGLQSKEGDLEGSMFTKRERGKEVFC